MNLLTYLGVTEKQATDLITSLETITETLADAIAGKDVNPTSEQKASAILDLQSTGTQLRHIAANIRKH
jgi:hypothetical protein